MKANAPERLYLSKTIYSTYLYQVPDPDDETAVEYTRTDAFIKKAKKWIEEHVGLYEAFEPDSRIYYTDIETMVKDFTKYMKGE